MSETKVLHTDLLERQYGPVHIEVRKHDDVLRIVDISDGNNVCRTHAVTWLSAENYPRESEFGMASAEIKAGTSLGKTFRDHGFEIEKKLITQGMIQIPEWLERIFQIEGRQASFRIYDFIAIDGNGVQYFYGVVCEIDSPDFLGESKSNQDGLIKDESHNNLEEKYLGMMTEYLKTGTYTSC